jgi:hypothetical protein
MAAQADDVIYAERTGIAGSITVDDIIKFAIVTYTVSEWAALSTIEKEQKLLSVIVPD